MTPNDAFCMLPWVQLVGGFAGDWKLCCDMLDGSARIAERGEDITAAWNSPAMRRTRLQMLAGEHVAHCRPCYELEQANLESPRLWSNQHWKEASARARATRADGSIPDPLVSLDIRFSNLCNFSCRICSHTFSSRWYEDGLKLGQAAEPRVSEPWGKDEAFWQRLREDVLPAVQSIYFAGGEPLIQGAHYRVLGVLREIGRTDVQLYYNTNLSVLEYRGRSVLDEWAPFEHVRLLPSIDALGARGEFLRKGFSWETWKENANRVRERIGGYAATVSVYNAWHLPDLVLGMREAFPELRRCDGGLVCRPECLSVQIFDREMKERLVERYGRFIADHPELTPSEIANMRTVLAYMNGNDKSHLAPEFKRFNQILDRARGEHITRTFPELAGWWSRIGGG